MCGIAGILSISTGKPVTTSALNNLIEPITHRGPDGSGVWLSKSGHVGFGHRRLSIIDLSENGKQPFQKEDLSLTITYNGEIYNYIELKQDLEKKGHRFLSSTDTEVVLAAYKEYGSDCLAHFDGMFAFAIWDENKQELFCARDRFGEKPFYYYFDNKQFVFASEIKQFWGADIKKELSKEKLSRFITYSEVISDTAPERTFYTDIFSLKPAHFLICKPNLNIIIKEYWGLKNTAINTKISFQEAIDKFLILFNRSVQLRLRSDVPVGSSLSGGIDSSAIVYSINKHFLNKGQKQFTFSARFNNYEKDEGEYIDELLAQLKDIKRHDVFLDAAEFEQDIQQIIYHQDEPFQSASIFAQYKVMQLARKSGVTVLLDGQGADELLGGYETLYIDYLKQLFYNNPSVYSSEAKCYNNMHGSKHGNVDLNKNDTAVLKLKRKVKRAIGKEQAVPQNYFSETLKKYITGSQLQQLLRYADRNSMAHSVETRLPFLNHELVEFVFSLPDDFKLKEGWPKFILRKAFDHKLPDKITWRKNKVGFETPEARFLERTAAHLAMRNGEQYILDNKLNTTGKKVDRWLTFMLGSYIKN